MVDKSFLKNRGLKKYIKLLKFAIVFNFREEEGTGKQRNFAFFKKTQSFSTFGSFSYLSTEN